MLIDDNERYREKAHRYIPSGAHTYSRTDEVFPANAPAVISHSSGVYTWDVEENKYLDYAMACRSVTIGYGNERICNAAIEQILNGNTASKASKIEVDAAEMMCNLIPWVEMVKFAKNGSTVTSAAVKLSRAYTGKKYVARCYDHSFFSYDDWFIGDTVVSRGIPQEISDLTLHFKYNDIASLESLFREYNSQIACVILEPSENEKPKEGFLQSVRKLCDDYSALLIMDEMITGFRWDMLGACNYYGVIPDLVTYGKGMANGFSVAALGGKREIMELGGNTPGEERVFLISTTHGAEMSGLGAFCETMKIYQEEDVIGHMWKKGEILCTGLEDIAKEYGISDHFYITGEHCSPTFWVCGKDGKPSSYYRTVFCQEMIKHKIIMPYISIAYSHKDLEIEYTLESARKALAVLRDSLCGNVKDYIIGEPIKSVFRRVN